MRSHLSYFVSVFCLVLGLAALALPAPASEASSTLAAPAPPPVMKAADIAAARIANAMSAAPMAIARDATIRDWLPESIDPLIVLDKTWVRRQGTNGWTCYADWPASPGNDPQCNNPEAEAWFGALINAKGAPPKATSLGIIYMLQGGSDPSNTDSMAALPAAAEDWITSGPHIMLVAPRGFDATKFSTDPDSGQPWIMWDGTPYEHLMVPVVSMVSEAMGDVSVSMKSAMSAAPAGVAGSATLLDWLPENG